MLSVWAHAHGKSRMQKGIFIVRLKGHTVGTSYCLDVHRACSEVSLRITTVSWGDVGGRLSNSCVEERKYTFEA